MKGALWTDRPGAQTGTCLFPRKQNLKVYIHRKINSPEKQIPQNRGMEISEPRMQQNSSRVFGFQRKERTLTSGALPLTRSLGHSLQSMAEAGLAAVRASGAHGEAGPGV